MPSAIGKALGYSMEGMSEDEPSEEGLSEDVDSMEPEKKSSSMGAEVLAMKQFERAKTPEAKAQALKDFLEACGVY